MIRSAIWVVRQRRYRRLAILMLFVAAGCVAAGTWQISRYEQTRRDNRDLRDNAHAAVVDVGAVLAPATGTDAAPLGPSPQFRRVHVTGTYLAAQQLLVRERSVNGNVGYLVLVPLLTGPSTRSPALLVVRGFVAADDDGNPPATVPPAPTGVQRVVGRLQTADSSSDQARALANDEIDSVNPGEQAARLGAPVFDAYLTLRGAQPGTAGLTALPEPDLSNPAGGAVEPQHLAYIVQWYLFALLALAAPFVIARSEVHEARRKFLGFDPDAGEFGLEAPPDRLSLPDGSPARADLAVREPGTLAPRAARAQTWDRAERLASRYGRSLSTGNNWRPDPSSFPGGGAFSADRAGPAVRDPGDVVATSAERPHRSPDAYHGSYNDYLWQLAMADGATPPVLLAPVTPKPVHVDVVGPTVDLDREPGERERHVDLVLPTGDSDAQVGPPPADGSAAQQPVQDAF